MPLPSAPDVSSLLSLPFDQPPAVSVPPAAAMPPAPAGARAVGTDLTAAMKGDQIREVFAVTSRQERATKAGAPFLVIGFVNQRGQRIEGKVWQDGMAAWQQIEKGDPVLLTAKVDAYNGALELKVNAVERLAKPHPVLDCLNPVYPGDIGALRAELESALDTITDPGLQAFVQRFFRDPDATVPLDTYFLCPAARNNHHAHLHGLADHSLELRRLALGIVDRLGAQPDDPHAAITAAVTTIAHPGLRRFVELTLAAPEVAETLDADAPAFRAVNPRGVSVAHVLARQVAVVDTAATQPMIAPAINRSLCVAGALVSELGPAVLATESERTNLYDEVTANTLLLRRVFVRHAAELAAAGFTAAHFDDLLHTQVAARGTQADGAPNAPASLEATAVAHARRAVMALARVTPDTPAGLRETFDRDILSLGMILHDVGKVTEYVFDGEPIDTSPTYKLYSHLTSGAFLIDECVERNRAALTDAGLRPSDVQRLIHIVISHHLKPEWGSPKAPITPEAVLAHEADNLSAKLREIVQILSEQTPNPSRDITNGGKHYRGGLRVAMPETEPVTATTTAAAEDRLTIALEDAPVSAAAPARSSSDATVAGPGGGIAPRVVDLLADLDADTEFAILPPSPTALAGLPPVAPPVAPPTPAPPATPVAKRRSTRRTS